MEPSGLVAKPIEDPFENLVNTTATCLIREPSFYQTAESRVVKLINACDAVAKIDPEFILLLAYYARNELYLRSSTNFLLAYAATKLPNPSELLKKYMPHCIKLPTDLLEVVEITQALMKSSDSKKLVLPSALKKVCKTIFSGFSVYHLGKYCSENARKHELIKAKKRAKPEEAKAPAPEGSYNEHSMSGNEDGPMPAKVADKDRKKVPMKKLIRTCHIDKPKYEVMSILGKKYPVKEEFEKEFPGKKFNETKIGKRMRLPVPITWETELSAKGNKAEVWSELISSNKLPYMAMLRNLRNMIVTGVPAKTHELVCEKIQNYDAVVSSKLFPFRFFSAYDVLNIDLSELQQKFDHPEGKKETEEEKKGTKKRGRHIGRRQVRGGRGGRRGRGRGRVASAAPGQRFKKKPKYIVPKEMPTKETIENYKKALNNAIKIAIGHNVRPIKGKSVVFSDTSGSMGSPVSGGKGLGSIRSCMQVGLLMSVMMKYACEECDFYIFSSPGETGSCYEQITTFNKEDLLANIESIQQESHKLGGGTDFPFEFWLDAIEKKRHIDLFVIFSDMMITEGHSDIGGTGMTAAGIVNEYRRLVNPNLIYVAIDLRGYSIKVPIDEDTKDPHNIMVCGYSDSILRFISERQLSQVEYIKSLKGKIN